LFDNLNTSFKWSKNIFIFFNNKENHFLAFKEQIEDSVQQFAKLLNLMKKNNSIILTQLKTWFVLKQSIEL
jgi:hypothetical protein